MEKWKIYAVRSNSSWEGYGQNQNRRLYRTWNILCENKEGEKEIVREGLTDEEANCIYVEMSYHDGNPPRSFYDKLAKEEWFTMEGVTAENYLATDLYDFYLIIRIHDYRLEQLSDKEQENVVNSLENIEKRLLEKYGEDASFQILYGEYNVKYEAGVNE